MNWSDLIPPSTVRLVAAVLWGMIWSITAGYLALIYLTAWAFPLFPAVAYVVIKLVWDVPVLAWSPWSLVRQAAGRGATGMPGPGSTT
jgi:hypothetical protein